MNVQKGVGLAMLFSKSSVSQKILFWKETAINSTKSNTSTVAVWYTVNMDGNLSLDTIVRNNIELHNTNVKLK